MEYLPVGRSYWRGCVPGVVVEEILRGKLRFRMRMEDWMLMRLSLFTGQARCLNLPHFFPSRTRKKEYDMKYGVDGDYGFHVDVGIAAFLAIDFFFIFSYITVSCKLAFDSLIYLYYQRRFGSLPWDLCLCSAWKTYALQHYLTHRKVTTRRFL